MLAGGETVSRLSPTPRHAGHCSSTPEAYRKLPADGLQMPVRQHMERKTRLELATFSLANRMASGSERRPVHDVRRYSAKIATTAAPMIAWIANPKATESLPEALAARFARRDGIGLGSERRCGAVGVSETAEGISEGHGRSGASCS